MAKLKADVVHESVYLSLLRSQIQRDLWTKTSSLWRPESLCCLSSLMLPDWVAQQESHTLRLCARDNAKNNLSILALLLHSFLYRTHTRPFPFNETGVQTWVIVMENANIVPNGFPSQESFKTYVNLCKPNWNTYLQ